MVSRRCVLSARPLIIETENGELIPLPEIIGLARVTMYDLDGLKSDLRRATEFLPITDERLARAVEYFEHALHLVASRAEEMLSVRDDFLVSSAFLHFWKAATAIVGDPSVHADQYQKRYKAFGLDEQMKSSLDELKALRDKHDVAHYSLDSSQSREVSEKLGQALSTAADVIEAYRDHLLAEGTEEG